MSVGLSIATDHANLSRPTAAVVAHVHDGDTLDVYLDLATKPLIGIDLWADVPIRLAGCNARELAQPGGPEARDNLAALLPPGTQITVTVVHGDKYGSRRDAHIQLPDGSDLVQRLVAEGWVAAWDGIGGRPVPAWPRQSTPNTTTCGPQNASGGVL